ncbi:MAG: LLM class flavin-dependent oxidoreductase [Pseudomonadales bacterium]|jgi:alkanesulfonate monooxygenase SsuD/methylene tetrahydromethanopterin reductase-like flavin-dependent oxidoreductase (luciferase family)|nr:LLM class flavin-dependent oxidoreductase [Pseudomonadales bacterium]MDP7359435.1 LLM class flavin-dependent oxidoreductase [Pseudomonadales bacterium]MDP7597532.1 LLM class flavin-dependent oxidoreductase [Pseudomonadales bacterium]HJN51017.1 LLM class flavin-dependent oxidoreductase [Pseudomonadales bacterium]|tara:strand:+ start:2730 stop:3500 length:771 start_codon:yes stop_codon:yes gene_type:complete
MSISISVELSHICPLDEITDHANALESYGFHRVWVPDTVVSQWEAWLAASLIVHHTDVINIGLGVTNPYTRHPVVVAQMAATLQNISGGRLAISLGKGIGRFLDKAGIEQHETAVEECITALHNMIAGERTNLDGEAFRIDGMLLRTIPPSNPVPIYLAAVGPASWDIAVRVADGVATVWTDMTADNYRRSMADRQMPTAVLIPFALGAGEFLGNKAGSLPQLKDRVQALDDLGFDEVIIGYRDRNDLDIAAQLIT